MGVLVQPVTADAVRPLRQAVLRPNQPIEATVYPSDDAPGTFHAAATDGDGRIVGAGSVSPEPHPRDPRPGDWRLRGMATDPSVRGQGAGAAVLTACLDHVRASGGTRLWCNARAAARGFYERMGFAVESEPFELPGIGRHFVMSRPV